jgi:hypothetical protein
MLTARISGGLGNQLFVYALGYVIAKKMQINLRLEIYETPQMPRNFELDRFNISFNNVLKSRYFLGYKYIRDIMNFLSKIIYKKAWYFSDYLDYGVHKYIPIDTETLSKNCYLIISGQCEKYFAGYEDDIRREFQFKEPVSKESMSLFQKFDGQNTVSVHIRRGDYALEENKLLGSVCTPAYYQNAISHILANVTSPVFIVFSEDLEWVRANIKIPEPCFYIDSLNKPASHDMQFMSLCKHNIISNSSYSWWAAWLNKNPGKIIIAPDKWWADGRETCIYTDNMVRVSTEEEKCSHP